MSNIESARIQRHLAALSAKFPENIEIDDTRFERLYDSLQRYCHSSSESLQLFLNHGALSVMEDILSSCSDERTLAITLRLLGCISSSAMGFKAINSQSTNALLTALLLPLLRSESSLLLKEASLKACTHLFLPQHELNTPSASPSVSCEPQLTWLLSSVPSDFLPSLLPLLGGSHFVARSASLFLARLVQACLCCGKEDALSQLGFYPFLQEVLKYASDKEEDSFLAFMDTVLLLLQSDVCIPFLQKHSLCSSVVVQPLLSSSPPSRAILSRCTDFLTILSGHNALELLSTSDTPLPLPGAVTHTALGAFSRICDFFLLKIEAEESASECASLLCRLLDILGSIFFFHKEAKCAHTERWFVLSNLIASLILLVENRAERRNGLPKAFNLSSRSVISRQVETILLSFFTNLKNSLSHLEEETVMENDWLIECIQNARERRNKNPRLRKVLYDCIRTLPENVFMHWHFKALRAETFPTSACLAKEPLHLLVSSVRYETDRSVIQALWDALAAALKRPSVAKLLLTNEEPTATSLSATLSATLSVNAISTSSHQRWLSSFLPDFLAAVTSALNVSDSWELRDCAFTFLRIFFEPGFSSLSSLALQLQLPSLCLETTKEEKHPFVRATAIKTVEVVLSHPSSWSLFSTSLLDGVLLSSLLMDDTDTSKASLSLLNSLFASSASCSFLSLFLSSHCKELGSKFRYLMQNEDDFELHQLLLLFLTHLLPSESLTGLFSLAPPYSDQTRLNLMSSFFALDGFSYVSAALSHHNRLVRLVAAEKWKELYAQLSAIQPAYQGSDLQKCDEGASHSSDPPSLSVSLRARLCELSESLSVFDFVSIHENAQRQAIYEDSEESDLPLNEDANVDCI